MEEASSKEETFSEVIDRFFIPPAHAHESVRASTASYRTTSRYPAPKLYETRGSGGPRKLTSR